MHTIYSHDACDGEPVLADGTPNEACLMRLREALCHNRMDYTMLTDHPVMVADVSLEAALVSRNEDVWIRDEADQIVASRLTCPDGPGVILTVGFESDLMGIALRRKPANPEHYHQASVEAVAGLREAGASVFMPHTERYTAEEIGPLNLDGIEIYNLHHNLDPRGQLPEVIVDLARLLTAGGDGPHPDLGFLAAFRESPRALAAWDGLTPHQRAVGIAGSDIHENLENILRPADGERLDAYRRLGSWFSNYLLTEQVEYEALRRALDAGRLFVCFDVLGTPDGFDFHGVTAGGEILEMGTERPFEPGVILRGQAPISAQGATIELRLQRITTDGVETVATLSDGPLEHTVEAPGVYRLEVWQVPEHLRPELGEYADMLVRPLVWIYANPIYLR